MWLIIRSFGGGKGKDKRYVGDAFQTYQRIYFNPIELLIYNSITRIFKNIEGGDND